MAKSMCFLNGQNCTSNQSTNNVRFIFDEIVSALTICLLGCFFSSSSSNWLLLFVMFGGLLPQYMWEKFLKSYTVIIMQWFSVNAADNCKCCIDFPLTCSLIFHCCTEHAPRNKKEIVWPVLKYVPNIIQLMVLAWIKQKSLFQIQIRTLLRVKVSLKFVFYNKPGIFFSKINLANAIDKCQRGQFHCSDEIL